VQPGHTGPRHLEAQVVELAVVLRERPAQATRRDPVRREATVVGVGEQRFAQREQEQPLLGVQLDSAPLEGVLTRGLAAGPQVQLPFEQLDHPVEFVGGGAGGEADGEGGRDERHGGPGGHD